MGCMAGVRRFGQAVLGCGVFVLTTGCDLNLEDAFEDLESIELAILSEVDSLQAEEIEINEFPEDLIDSGGEIILEEEVIIVDDVQEDLFIEILPDITLVGFENLTGLDGFYTYFADGVEQSILVFDGETVLLEYPCLGSVELFTEDYFDPFTGLLVESFEDEDAFFVNPLDFECGEAIIFTFEIDGVFAGIEAIDLID